MQPHYQRIATEIAGRIRRGELQPGDAVPSTRQIVREWGVAMATATKVIGVLRDRGLVDAVPGSGTHVRSEMEGRTDASQGHPTPPRARRSEPTEQDVLDVAVRIADEDGLDLLTMRRLANSLGVSTMSLYRYASSKGELTQQMADRVFADVRIPDIPTVQSRTRLETAARIFREVFALHPWAAGLFSLTRPQLLPNVLPLAEWNLQTLRAMGLGIEEMMFAHISLFGLVANMSRVSAAEQQAMADTGQSADAWAAQQADGLPKIMPTSRFPAFTYVIQQGFDFDLNALFEYGLQRMLDGIEGAQRS